MIITCKIHGDFEQSRHNHITKKHGCHECAKISSNKDKTKSIEQFIRESIEVHCNKYDYSKSIYNEFIEIKSR